MTPRVSVIMPVHNAEKFVGIAIDSILNQSFSDFEFIIVDDASTDSTIDIIESYSDSRIRFYKNEENMGITETLNYALDLCEGEYVARMDADDVSHKDRLKQQVHHLDSDSLCGMVSSSVRLISEEGEQIGTDCTRSEYYFFNLIFVCWIYHPTVMYRRDVVFAVGKYQSKFSEDFDLFWHITRRWRIYNIPSMLLDYRVTSVSLSRSTKKTENEKAQEEQVRRNVRYYVAERITLTDTDMHLLRHNFHNINGHPKKAEIRSCLKKLRMIRKAVEAKENPNRDEYWIQRACRHRRLYILQYYAARMPFRSAVDLLLRTRALSQLGRYIFTRSAFRKITADIP